MESIPVAIQEDILIRLPLKSLLACSYGCKKLKTIICNEDFKTRYLLRSTTRHMDPTPDSLFHSIYRQPQRYTVSAPIRGWISVKSSFILRVYNPITNEILSLPDNGEIGKESDEIFGYDEANGVFKVLGFFSRTFEVYTVRPGGEGSWRIIAFEHPHMYNKPLTRYNFNSFPPLSLTNALCKGGVLYYTAKTLPGLAPIIMSFDLSSEEFSVNPLPEGFIVDHRSTMVNYNGKVALVNNNSATELRDTGGFQICVRNEDSGQWELQRVVIPGWRDNVENDRLFCFVGTIGTGELVFTAPSSLVGDRPESVLYYTPGKGITGTLTLEGANKDVYHYVRACLNHFECLFRTA